MKKVFIKTFGCQMNEYDSGKMADILLSENDYAETKVLEDADLILLNTCSIREKAQDKVFSDLGRLRDLKAEKPHLLIGVGGCVASQEGHQIISRAPYVDLVLAHKPCIAYPKCWLKETVRDTLKSISAFLRLKNLTTYHQLEKKGVPLLSPLWRAALNTAHIVLSLLHVVRRSLDHSLMS